MKTMTLAAFAALAALTSATAAMSQPAAPAPMAAPAKLTVDSTPIETLVANPAAKAVLDKDIPGLTTHPAYDQFKSMSLTQVQPMSQGQLTDDMIKAVQADLDKIK